MASFSCARINLLTTGAFAPLQVVRVKDSADSKRPDGLGSVRRMG